MPHARAKQILEEMNPDVGMRTRVEFVRLIAAFARIYTDDLDVRVDGRTVRSLLLSACKPDRIEWYLNGVRVRDRLTKDEDMRLGAGTTRNEQLHHTLNARFKSVTQISKQMLDAQVKTWLVCDMKTRVKASDAGTTRRYTRSTSQTVAIHASELFTNEDWTSLLDSDTLNWQRSSPHVAGASRKRRGGSSEQLTLWEHMRAKKSRGKRPPTYS